MDELTRNGARPHDGRAGSLVELIHAAVRRTIEVAVDEELTAALGVRPYERGRQRRGYRNGTKPRTVTGPTGPLALRVPRGSLFTTAGPQEWASRLVS
jgi:transposase-like protein